MMLALTWEQAAALHDIGLALSGPRLHPAMVRACDRIEASRLLGREPADVPAILRKSGVTAAMSVIDGGDGLLSAVLAAFGEGGELDA